MSAKEKQLSFRRKVCVVLAFVSLFCFAGAAGGFELDAFGPVGFIAFSFVFVGTLYLALFFGKLGSCEDVMVEIEDEWE